MTVKRGRPFLVTPGPTPVPERILNAMHRQPIDYNGGEMVALAKGCLEGVRPIFKTEQPVYIYTASGHGAWEAALANTLSPGDRILVPETGNFSLSWSEMAGALGLEIDYLENDWRHGIDPGEVEARLREDRNREIKALLMVHTDTATGITSDVAAVRAAIDRADHPALLMVDTIASLATVDFRTDEWRVDVAVAACQKGLMMPPGLSFTAVSAKAQKAAETATMPRRYWDWSQRQLLPHYNWFCGTPPEHLLFGLRESIDMVMEEGLEAAFARHARLAGAVRAAVSVWAEAGALEFNAMGPSQRADSTTTILVPEEVDGEHLRITCGERFQVALGAGLRQLKGRAFRIGHMGDINEPMILGTLASVEATLKVCGVPYREGGVTAAIDHLAEDESVF